MFLLICLFNYLDIRLPNSVLLFVVILSKVILLFFVTARSAATLKLNIRHDRDGDGVVIVIITFQTTQPNQTTTPCQYCQGRHHGGGG